MKIHVSHTNSKLGSEIPSVNLPPVLTCRPDAPCFKECYARKGHWNCPNVKTALGDNLEAYKADPDFFFRFISATTRLSRYVRWHSAGDIVDARYLKGMCDVARDNPDTRYLAFTKKFDLVNTYIAEGNEIPTNLHIVYSGWDENFVVDNPYDFPVAYIALDGHPTDYIPEDAIPCGGKCDKCLACWQLQRGQSVYFEEH